ncbi:MAG: cupin domain-containing protein [Actinobacteria bacterium]|nr:cupin domain-containing protein [Actinomycetota bacterium]
MHPRSRESFQLVAGQLWLRIGGQERILQAPATIDIPAGTAHTFWNDGPETASIAVSFEPAGTFEHFLETVYELAADRRTNSKGVPNPLRMAVIAREHLNASHSRGPPWRFNAPRSLFSRHSADWLATPPGTHATAELIP